MQLTLRRAVLSAMIAEAVALVGAFTALVVISRTRSAQEFGAYTLLTRFMAVLQPICLLGTGVVLPRLLPRSSRDDARRLILAATLLVLAPVSGFALVAVLPAVQVAVLQDAQHVTGLSSLTVLLTGSVLHAIAYAALRGLQSYRASSLLFGWNMGVAPLACVLLTDGVTQLALSVGLVWALGSLAVLAACVGRPRRPGSPLDLARAGLGRVPGELSLFCITAAPPILVSQYDSVRASGTMSLAMTLLTSVGAAAVPLSAVLLPHVSAQLAAGDQASVRELLRRLCRTWVLGSLPALLLLELAVQELLPVVFAQRGHDAVPMARLLLLAAPGFVLFVMLRSIVDAATDRASTMRAATAAFLLLLVVFEVLHLLGASVQVASGVAAVASMWLLGLAVLLQAFRSVEFGGGLDVRHVLRPTRVVS